MSRTRTPGDGPRCWCGAAATFSGYCNAHYDTDTGRKIGPPPRPGHELRRLSDDERARMEAAARGTAHDQLGRALWNLLAPLHGEPPCYALGEQPWPTLDLADTDLIAHALPFANLQSVPAFSVLARTGVTIEHIDPADVWDEGYHAAHSKGLESAPKNPYRAKT